MCILLLLTSTPRCRLPVRSPPSRSADDIIYEMEQVINPAIPNRDFTQKCAASYGLKGWVRNTTCGKVGACSIGAIPSGDI